MELQNRYYQNLEDVAKILEIVKDSLVLQIKKISRTYNGILETDSYILQIRGLKPTQYGLLYLIHISDKNSNAY